MSIVTLTIVALLGIGVIQSPDSAIGGIFTYRFIGKDTSGEKKEDVTTGRADVWKLKFVLFKDNPIGVDVGDSRYYRMFLFNDN